MASTDILALVKVPAVITDANVSAPIVEILASPVIVLATEYPAVEPTNILAEGNI